MVSSDNPKEVMFVESVETWWKKAGEGKLNSQSLYLNMNPQDEDPMLSMVVMPPNLLDIIQGPWKDCLIVRLLRKNIGFKALDSRVKFPWNLQGDYEVVALDGGTLFLNFT